MDELYDHYDGICTERFNVFIHHEDLLTKLLPLIEENVSNDVRRRFFNEKCESKQVR